MQLEGLLGQCWRLCGCCWDPTPNCVASRQDLGQGTSSQGMLSHPEDSGRLEQLRAAQSCGIVATQSCCMVATQSCGTVATQSCGMAAALTTKSCWRLAVLKPHLALPCLPACLRCPAVCVFRVIGWNILDVIVIAAGWLELLGNIGNHTALRCIRLLRALRPVSRVPQLKVSSLSGVLVTVTCGLELLVRSNNHAAPGCVRLLSASDC